MMESESICLSSVEYKPIIGTENYPWMKLEMNSERHDDCSENESLFDSSFRASISSVSEIIDIFEKKLKKITD